MSKKPAPTESGGDARGGRSPSYTALKIDQNGHYVYFTIARRIQHISRPCAQARYPASHHVEGQAVRADPKVPPRLSRRTDRQVASDEAALLQFRV